jgi:hypothetical protein
MAREKRGVLTDKDVDQYELIMPLLDRMYSDIQELTKKRQDGVLSKTRIAMINRLLDSARDLLKGETSINFLDRLDEELMPQNADAMIIVGQYVSALGAFRERHTTVEDFEDRYWSISGSRSSRKA